MSIKAPSREHEVAYQEICALCSRHADKLSAQDLLAIAANMLGKLIALQDQRSMTPQQAMRIVSENIRLGNEQALAQIRSASGTPQ